MQKDFRRFSSASLAATCALTPCLTPPSPVPFYFLLDNHLALLLSVLFRCRCWCCCCCCCPSCLVSFADCCTTQSAQWHLLFWRQLLHSYGSCHFLPTPFPSPFTIPFPTLVQSRVLSIFNSLFDQGKKLSSSECWLKGRNRGGAGEKKEELYRRDRERKRDKESASTHDGDSELHWIWILVYWLATIGITDWSISTYVCYINTRYTSNLLAYLSINLSMPVDDLKVIENH